MPKINLSGVEATSVPKPPTVALSVQQLAAIDFVRNPSAGNLLLVAVAGSGKTFTLIEVCKYLQGQVAYGAFNKKIADEIGRKLIASGVDKGRVRASTFHSFGFQAWTRVAKGVKVNAEKVSDLLEEMDVPKNLWGFTRQLVSLAKQHGVGVLTPEDNLAYWQEMIDHFDLEEKLYQGDEDFTQAQIENLRDLGLEWSRRVLGQSILLDPEVIDFDDMIYSPLLHEATFWKNDWVLIDEAQDTNPVRREMARRMLKDDGRLIAVGDPHQAIYGFTGADADALDLIMEEFSCTRLPLSVSFRCAQRVVAHAQRYVSHIEAADWAPQGTVRTVYLADFKRLTPDRTDAILCRNTRPLIEMAFDFLRRMIPAHVEGRDIGNQLMTLVKKWRSARTVDDLRGRLEEYHAREMSKFFDRGQESKAAALDDKVRSLLCIMDNLGDDDPVYKVGDLVNKLFKDTDGQPLESITLSTVHKSKGREWERVWLYGRNLYMPSPFAKQLWQIEQENNLIYVAITRAKTELIEVFVE